MTIGISPTRLLAQAERLAGIGAGRGRPRPTDLRRATSSAYYALYHGVTRFIAWRSLPDRPEPEWLRLTRSVSHAAVRQTCDLIAGSGKNRPANLSPLVDQASSDPDLVRMCEAFGALQDARHRADYDHLASVTKAEVVTQIADVRDVLSGLDILSQRTSFDVFRTMVLLKSQAR